MSDDDQYSPYRRRFDPTANAFDGQTSSGDTESDNDDDIENTSGEFDKSLPATHRYLGRLDNVGGYTLLDEGDIFPSMLAVHTNTMVFPGFTLPLVLRHYETERLYEDIKKGFLFALICGDRVHRRLFEYGIVMQVYETSNRRNTINLKAKGRQRCRIMPNASTRNPWVRLQKLAVKVLGEPCMKSPIANSQLSSLRMRRTSFKTDHESLRPFYKYRRYHLSQYPYPSWVYDHNELSYLVHLVSATLAKFYPREHLPQEPIALSYWFVQNYQLTHEERLEILRCSTALERLRLELKYVEVARNLICRRCGVDIAKQSDLFAMSREGVQSNYCNPGGQVYETITASKIQNYSTVGEPSKQFSWFPGYYWTIIQCKSCTSHLGWVFTSQNHQPESFFGLAHSSLDIKKMDDKSGDEEMMSRDWLDSDGESQH